MAGWMCLLEAFFSGSLLGHLEIRNQGVDPFVGLNLKGVCASTLDIIGVPLKLECCFAIV